MLPLEVVAVDYGDLDNWRDTLLSWFNPYLGPGILRYQRHDGGLRQISAIYQKRLEFDTSSQVGAELHMSINLYCPDPFWYDPNSSVTYSYMLSGSTTGQLYSCMAINNDASGLVWPEFTLTGPFSDPIITLFRPLQTGRISTSDSSRTWPSGSSSM